MAAHARLVNEDSQTAGEVVLYQCCEAEVKSESSSHPSIRERPILQKNVLDVLR